MIYKHTAQLWETIVEDLTLVKNEFTTDPILQREAEMILTRVESAIVNDSPVVSETTERMTNILGREDYYKKRYFKDNQVSFLLQLQEKLSAFTQVASSEEKQKPVVEKATSDRLPNAEPTYIFTKDKDSKFSNKRPGLY